MSTPSDSSSSEENTRDTAHTEDVQPHPMQDLPPEAQGEANGGPLGCCLGTTIGLLLSVSIALLSRFYADPLFKALSTSLSLIVRIVMVLVAILAMIICGYLGWRIGKIIYREYEPPVVKRQPRRRKKTRVGPKPSSQ